MHPERLISHLTKVYSHDSCFNQNNDFALISTYFHTLEDNGYPIGMHSHTFYEVNIIVEGKGYHYIEQQNLEVNVGDVFVLPPFLKHGYYTNDPNFKICHILLSSVFVERYKTELSALPGFTILFETEPFWRTITTEKMFLTLNKEQFNKVFTDIKALIDYESSEYTGNEIQKIFKTLNILSYFSELIYKEHKQKFDSPQLRTESVSVIHTIEYLQSNLHEKITTDELAKLAHMSRSTYLRHFKKLCKCTPQQYLTELRIKKATEMLEKTNRSITEISQDCGFFDSAHFSHIFYKIKGVPPSSIRKNL